MGKPLFQVRTTSARFFSNRLFDYHEVHTDGTFRVWDPLADLATTTNDHSGFVTAVAISDDAKLVATGGSQDDKIVKIWDAVSGDLLHNLIGHEWSIHSLAFSPDGGKLASGSGDYTVRIWDVNAGNLLYTLTGHNNYVHDVGFTSDGRKLISRTGNETYVFDLEGDGVLLSTIREENEGPSHQMYGMSEGFGFGMGEWHRLLMHGSSAESSFRIVGAVPEEFRIGGFQFKSNCVVFVDVSGLVLILDISKLKDNFL